jgi:hypothetical protein
MDYKTVMVCLALDRPNDACFAVAGDLAERFGARIIGIAASDLRPPTYFAEGDFAQELFDEESFKGGCRNSRQSFAQRSRSALYRMSAFRLEILVGHQRRHRHAPEHFMGDAAKNPFLQTRMSVAAHHQ